MNNVKRTLETEKKKALALATDLCYDEKCKQALKNATSIAQIEIALYGARQRTEWGKIIWTRRV